MRKAIKQFRNRSGFSMTELLMVMVVITIVAALALLQFGGSRGKFQRQNVAQQLKQAFERARFDSVKRRADNPSTNYAKVVLLSSTSFSLVTDNNGNGNTTDTEDSLTTNIPGGITISGNSLSFPVTVAFDARGEVTVTGAASPEFVICNGSCSFATDNTSNANIVLVTRTGTVNLLAGGSAIPTFSPPPVTTVPPNSNVRSDVTLP